MVLRKFWYCSTFVPENIILIRMLMNFLKHNRQRFRMQTTNTKPQFFTRPEAEIPGSMSKLSIVKSADMRMRMCCCCCCC
jgi:hypothetical protein